MSPIGGLALLGAAVPTALLAALLVGRRVSVGSARRSAVSRPPGSAASRTVAWLRRRLRARAAGSELGIICACVAARVRSGEEPAHAWASELVDRGWAAPADAAGGPRVGRNGSTGAATLPDTGQLPQELVALVGSSAGADAALVATRVALRSGAPLADVLDAVSVAIAEAEAADADRRRAQAGPATTARLLGWLPLGALVLGAGLGADPISTATDGGLGLVSMTAGIALMLVGRAWARALVRAAARDDEDSAVGHPRRARGGTS